MSNLTTFGIIEADIMRYLNPSYSYSGFNIQNIEAGAACVGGSKIVTVSTASWKINQWAGWKVYANSNFYDIASNTATALTLSSGDLSGYTGSYKITTQTYDVSETEFDTLIARAVSLVKGEIPERYRKMCSKIEGEIICEKSYDGQTTANLSFASSSDTTLYIWKNLRDFSIRRIMDALEITTDYTIDAGKTVITFVNELGDDEKVVADYDHSLSTVPTLLKELGILKTIIIMINEGYCLQDKTSINFEAHKKIYTDYITGLNKGEIGISEFDTLKLIDETKLDSTSFGFGSREVLL